MHRWIHTQTKLALHTQTHILACKCICGNADAEDWEQRNFDTKTFIHMLCMYVYWVINYYKIFMWNQAEIVKHIFYIPMYCMCMHICFC